VRSGTLLHTLVSVGVEGLSNGVYLFLLESEGGPFPVNHRFVVAR
jgi:hypothetical protein